MFVQILQAVDPALFRVDSLSAVATLVVATPVVQSTITATTTPLVDLTKRTTRVVELTRPGAAVPITGDFIISNVVAVRGVPAFPQRFFRCGVCRISCRR